MQIVPQAALPIVNASAAVYDRSIDRWRRATAFSEWRRPVGRGGGAGKSRDASGDRLGQVVQRRRRRSRHGGRTHRAGRAASGRVHRRAAPRRPTIPRGDETGAASRSRSARAGPDRRRRGRPPRRCSSGAGRVAMAASGAAGRWCARRRIQNGVRHMLPDQCKPPTMAGSRGRKISTAADGEVLRGGRL